MVGGFLHLVISSTVPVVLASIGGMFSNVSGKLNIGLEGMILTSAFFGVYSAYSSKSLLVGILAGIISSCVLAFVMAYLSFFLKANIFVVGLATNLFAMGLTVFLGAVLFGSKGTLIFDKAPLLRNIELPIKNIDFLRELLSGYNIIEYSTPFLVLLSHLVLFKTPFGYRLRAIGKNETAAADIGINVRKTRTIAYLAGGIFTGLSGLALSLPLGSFVAGMSNNRGWMALVAVILGGEKPVNVMVVSFFFGLITSLSNVLQTSTKLPSDLLMSLPYFATVLAMVLYSLTRKRVWFKR
ncbi:MULTISPECIES: ABC transporter permease [Pseudothermotoga]|jgi:simple sugar transport system permease protein|uniref:Inner-membrane translocator n=1 Tax=Pseudothermotoga lettingae (strain ATCC BAA-301 / DSM 14385 / NBRC 107922 / TMO) TaxID=416591 RepID=A8F423_PSELT|nr:MULTISPECIES: ABC transporter permease [Pseudothermotoga]ABV32907.1 inner-membrane translocator [Pseudothermotoga lettingae TMO]KUK21804.1 MAG: Inner-membrane translocator [Pseudothermotoga lettingae]MDK2884957.1 riboflavin transport system permease protein [Pseudothermotoga sp.]GLI48094.1 sugar ABC transporter permease [Pseudothermotoga lettingae TMO]HBJ80531.1 ABC transporter permease [Pseudothermotoga sp.]